MDVSGLFNFDFGLTTIAGRVMPGIGIHKTISGTLGESAKGHITGGIMNVVPYLAAGIDIATYGKVSTSDMLEATAKSYGLTANVSTIGWGLTAAYHNSVAETISHNETLLRSVLTKFTSIKDISAIDALDLGNDLSKFDADLIKNTIKNDLTVFGMGSLGRIQESYVTMLKEHQIRNASKDGYQFSGASLGVQFIGGFFPIPVAGASWEKVNLKYVTNSKEARNDSMSRLDPKSANIVTQAEFQAILQHELGDQSTVTKNSDGSISFKKPSHLGIHGLTDLATEKDGVVTIAANTQIKSWDRTSNKDAEFSIFLEKAPLKLDIKKITEAIKDTGFTVGEKDGKLEFKQ